MGPKLFCKSYNILQTQTFVNLLCTVNSFPKKCNGQDQSPIDIKFNGDTFEEEIPLVLSNYDEVRNIM